MSPARNASLCAEPSPARIADFGEGDQVAWWFSASSRPTPVGSGASVNAR
jgi:hypothetical protein